MSIRSASQSSIFSNKSTSAQRSQRTTTGTIDLEWLVIAGGGSGGMDTASGGGGAGGYLESSSSANVARPSAKIELNRPYTVTIGAGAARSSTYTARAPGSNSVFGELTAIGGGGGGTYGTPLLPNNNPPAFRAEVGGSGGGGAGRNYIVGAGGFAGTTTEPISAKQGNSGAGWGPGGYLAGACGNGGGGAGSGAAQINGYAAPSVGVGKESSITDSPVFRAGGGYGCGPNAVTSPSPGGGGGGSNASNAADDGAVNTGSGGGGRHRYIYTGPDDAGGAGGSGIVILRWLTADAVAKVGAGLTASETIDGSHTVLTITAGSDTVTWV